MSGNAESNRELVLNTFAQFAGGNIEVLRTVLAEDFVEHSPGNPSGRDPFIEFVANAPVSKARLELARVVADEQYVVVHYRMTTPDDELGTAVADIWRVHNGLIAEHWDVVQPVPAAAETPHGMF